MRAFVQEYGIAVVACVIVSTLIFVAVAVSKNGQGKLFGTYNGMNSKADTEMDNAKLSDRDGVRDGKVADPKDLSDICMCGHYGCTGFSGCDARDCVANSCECTK